jgi:phosphoribosylformylglycinamidine synthase
MHARLYVQKKPPFASARITQLRHELSHLNFSPDRQQRFEQILDQADIRLVYDLFSINQRILTALSDSIIGDSVTDTISTVYPSEQPHFAVELLPGQFDSRSAAVQQCLELMLPASDIPDDISISTAELYLFANATNDDLDIINAIKQTVINTVESREKQLATLEQPALTTPDAVRSYQGFTDFSQSDLESFIVNNGLAMNLADLELIQHYFTDQNRQPTETEIKVLDTYWSDHCRHTTFFTEITDTKIDSATNPHISASWQRYLTLRADVNSQKPICLMELGTIAAKALKQQGDKALAALEDSEEDNACSVVIQVANSNNGEVEPWLLMFKNETHNHPTEIDPFGGAATCIGGAIRDPLSGRAYVYQAMRITGAGYQSNNAPILPSKLPQTKICRDSAHGYSSYGNQIGLATSLVREIYHPNYRAKRMEVGMVVAGVKQSEVRRESPTPGDVVIMLGGKTGRDGIGGATGSSKAHTEDSVSSLSAEVQKGNAVEERKIQRLFRNPEFLALIKKSNDFGAGGVSVAIGELAESLDITLDTIPTKYAGLNGTELAISESQERMSIVIEAKDKDKAIAMANAENLLACQVATVTDSGYMRIYWRGEAIVELSRAFLNTNGAPRQIKTSIQTSTTSLVAEVNNSLTDKSWKAALTELNNASQRVLAESFDASIGVSTVLHPFGGKHQLSPEQVSAQTFLHNHQITTLASYGFSAELAMRSPYQAGQLAVVESIAKVIIAGAKLDHIWLSFQEYFGRLGEDAERWGIPMASLLGALDAQLGLGYAAIGGKDSMSGTFQDIDVPPTLISFAVGVADTDKVVSATLPAESELSLYWLPCPVSDDGQAVDLVSYKTQLLWLHQQVNKQTLAAARVVSDNGIVVALSQMAMGNQVGFSVANTDINWLAPQYAGIIIASNQLNFEGDNTPENIIRLGQTSNTATATINNVTLPLTIISQLNDQALTDLYPEPITDDNDIADPESLQATAETNKASTNQPTLAPAVLTASAKPQVILPIFPGTNCEYDTTAAFERAGATVMPLLIRNINSDALAESAHAVEKALNQGHILMLSGGFSLADEPDGAGKFIANFLRIPAITEQVHKLLERDGLVLGICNGFQALIKSGLIPYGQITERQETDATLTYNTAGRHVSRLANIRVTSNQSPWLANETVGNQYNVPLSHGEGRISLNHALAQNLAANQQIALQYCNSNGKPTKQYPDNPNGSAFAIEGLLSPCGKVLGRMAHPERVISTDRNGLLFQNIPDIRAHDIFSQGVNYFTAKQ